MGAGLVFLATALITGLGVYELQGGSPGDTNSRAVVEALVFGGFYVFLLGVIYVVIVHRFRSSWRTLGLRTVSWQWLAAVPFLFAALTFCYVLMFRGAEAVLGPTTQWPQPLKPSTIDATHLPVTEALVILTNVFLTPLAEELLFRGVLYQALRRTMPVGSAVVLSALIFAAMHLSVVLFIPFVLMGAVLALVYERSGSLVPTILLHACNNAIVLLIYVGATSQ